MDHAQLEAWKVNHQATVSTGQMAVRLAFLINGGAVVALLAFVGSLAGSGHLHSADIHALTGSFDNFGTGLICAASAACLGYVANRIILQSILKPGKWIDRWSGFGQAATVIAVVLSLVFFFFGLQSARDGILSLHFDTKGTKPVETTPI